jgi:hypothetical protein
MSTLADDSDETLCELLSLRLDDLADLSGTIVAPDELNLAGVSTAVGAWVAGVDSRVGWP